MKKHILAVSAIVMAMTIGTAAASFAGNIGINVNGKSVAALDAYVEDGVLMVPVRAVADAMGAEVKWNGDTKSIEITSSTQKIGLAVGNSQIKAGESNVDIKKAVKIINNTAYVSAEAFSYGFADVKWDEKAGTCTITPLKADTADKASTDKTSTDKTSTDKTSTDKTTTEGSLKGSVKADDGTELLNYDVKYLQLTADTQAAKTINAVLKSEAENAVEKFKTDNTKTQTDYLADTKKDSSLNYRPMSLWSNIDTYSDGTYFSVLNTFAYDFGGAHPTSVRISHVFKLADGKEATATELTGLKDETAVKDAVISGWTKDMAAHSEMYFSESADTLKKDYSSVSFYLADKKIVFYTQLYELAPYAAGFSEFSLAR